MKKQLLFIGLLLSTLISVKAQTWAWKNQLETSASSSIENYNDVAVDGFGNTYSAGYFDGSILFKGTTITTKGSNDILVTKTKKMVILFG